VQELEQRRVGVGPGALDREAVVVGGDVAPDNRIERRDEQDVRALP